MRFLQLKRRIILGGAVLLALFLVAAMQASIVTAATNGAASAASIQGPRQATNVPFNPEAERLRQMVHKGLLAPTVHVLDSLAPTTIVQFPLVPSGIKAAFPNAKGLVTIVRGNRDNAIADTVTVDVQNMPPNITFTIFYIEIATKPFGNVEYVADLTTRGDGSGETVLLAAGGAEGTKRQHAQRNDLRWWQSAAARRSTGHDRWADRAGVLGGDACLNTY